MNTNLLLASKSPYKQDLLSKLQLNFSCCDPAIDETPWPEETAKELAGRLAIEKARACSADYSGHLIIAADQTAGINGQILGKPGSTENAFSQLKMASGKQVRFYTGLCLLNTTSGKLHHSVEVFDVHFRNLPRQTIERYISKENPVDCTGSFKAEGLGISLFSKLCGDDPNTLTGLPLIRLVDFLAHEGVHVP